MLILIEAGAENASALTQAAKALNHPVHVIPTEAARAPGQPRLPGLTKGDFQWGLLFAPPPTAERYQGLHDEARALNITLLNDPAQHREAEDLSRTVNALAALTARTEQVKTPGEVDAALTRLPPPVFVRGAVSSAKALGWEACVARDAAQTKALVTKLLAMPEQAHGVVLLREVLPLRRLEKLKDGFPLSREYRLFVLDADVLGMGAYWDATDPFGALTERDEREIRGLAHEVARRLKVPWLTVDVGQLESGEWKVIETGDPACSGLGAVDPRALLGAVATCLDQRAGC